MEVVKFRLGDRYFKPIKSSPSRGFSSMSFNDCLVVVNNSLSLSEGELINMTRKFPCGFSVVCTHEQFSCFIIERYRYGNCINGIRDLSPERMEYTGPRRLSDEVSCQTGVSADDVVRVMDCLDQENKQCGWADPLIDVVARCPSMHLATRSQVTPSDG